MTFDQYKAELIYLVRMAELNMAKLDIERIELAIEFEKTIAG